MSVVSAFLVPGSPLPMIHPENPPWGRIADAMAQAGESLRASEPDVILVYSTQWFAVLDQLWQTRERLQGLHVDENWHEFGVMPFDITIDTELAHQCVERADGRGIKSKSVDFDQFPVDTGTIVASRLMDPDGNIPMVLSSNNLYHDWDTTVSIGDVAAQTAAAAGRKFAVIGIGGLSGSFFRHEIDVSEDRIENPKEDEWNKKILKSMEEGNKDALLELCPEFASEAKVDMGFKHLAFVLGAAGSSLGKATVHAYEPTYGAGAAVVEFSMS